VGQGIMDKQGINDQQTRAFVYNWFANLFAKEMDEETLEQYRSPMGQDLIVVLQKIEPIAPLMKELHQRIQKPEANSAIINRLAASFSSLFLGSGGHRTVPPYQSAFSGETARLYQEPASKMEALLSFHDLAPDLLAFEPADHLAIQLSLLAYLCEHKGEQAEQDFLTEFLLVWVPDFARACSTLDKEGFYGCAAVCLLTWLQSQSEGLPNPSVHPENQE
jgi:TorA-specific chaperone